MPRIQEIFKHARLYCARVKGIVVLAATKRLAVTGLKRTRKAIGENRFEVTQAVFPDKISDSRGTIPEG